MNMELKNQIIRILECVYYMTWEKKKNYYKKYLKGDNYAGYKNRKHIK